MEKARQEALGAFDDGEVPIGAVIVDSQGSIIARGANSMERLNDATAHAEILAIGAAASKMGSWRLNECQLYVTVEPCLMCLGAILNSRIGVVVYGAADKRMGAIDSFYFRQEAQRAYRWFPQVISGVLAQESAELLGAFFEKIRKKD
jgi:tRNA(adenine34) deaminase